jgi:hypothetical protein
MAGTPQPILEEVKRECKRRWFALTPAARESLIFLWKHGPLLARRCGV